MNDREKVIKELQRMADVINQYDDMLSVDNVDSWVILDALDLLKELVRCKDCKNWHINYVPIGEQHGCDVMRDYTPPDGYCFKGVKRDV